MSTFTKADVETTRKPHHFNQSLDRGLRILDLYTRDIATLSAKEIAEQLAVGVTTLYPFLHTLVSHGYLEVDDRKRYRLGLKLLERVGEIESVYDVRAIAREHMTKLSRSIAANARLGVLYGKDVLYLEQEEGGPAANAMLREVVGLRVPSHCTALGKVLLAFLADADREAFVDSLPLPQITEHTIVERGKLRDELALVRECGYALEVEELQPGSACVGAPIRNAGGRVIAAVSASIFASRVRGDERSGIVGAVVDAAATISRRLGHNGKQLTPGRVG
ncbi:MAG: IclR family transcriptional regulator [Candidatus Bipolaricaulota bacterium]